VSKQSHVDPVDHTNVDVQSNITFDTTNEESALVQHGFRNLQNCHHKQGGIQTGVRRHVAGTNTCVNQVDYSGRYRLEIDSRADTVCCGKGFIPMSEVDQVCDVLGFHLDMTPIKDVPVRTCATAFDHTDGETIILVFGQALYFGDSMEHSLLSPNQVRTFNHQLCLNPKQYTNGNSIHGISVDSDNLTLSFNMYGCISYLPIRTPTPNEIESCPHIILTLEEVWSPYSDTFNISENSYLPPHALLLAETTGRQSWLKS
jgi:hypothetical protein